MSVPVALLLAITSSCGLVSLKVPFVGVVGLAVLIFLRPQDLVPGLAAFHPVLLIAVPTILSTLWRWESQHRDKLNVLFPFLVFILFVFVSFLVRGTPLTSEALDSAKLLILMALVVLHTQAEERWNTLAVAVFIPVGAIACYGVANAYFELDLHTTGAVRGPGSNGGLFSNSNFFALALLTGLPFGLYLLHVGIEPIKRVACLAVLVLCIQSVILTESRSASVLFIGFLVTALLVKRVRLYALFLLFVYAAMALLGGENYQYRMSTVVQLNDYDNSQGLRLTTWQALLLLWRENPLVGVGLGNFVDAYKDAAPGLARYKTPHSVYLGLLVETGLAGVAAYLVFIGSTIWRLLRVYMYAPGEEWMRFASLAVLSYLGMFLAFGVFFDVALFSPCMIVIGLGLALTTAQQGRGAARSS